MGQCYISSSYYQWRGEKKKHQVNHLFDISSKELGMAFEDKRISTEHGDLSLNRIFNATCGIWFYETDLWDKEALKKQLYKLIDEALAKYSAEPITYSMDRPKKKQ